MRRKFSKIFHTSLIFPRFFVHLPKNKTPMPAKVFFGTLENVLNRHYCRGKIISLAGKDASLFAL